MEQILEFKNVEHTDDYISADLFWKGKLVVRFSVKDIDHLINSADTNIGLYEYFRQAMMICVGGYGLHNITGDSIC